MSRPGSEHSRKQVTGSSRSSKCGNTRRDRGIFNTFCKGEGGRRLHSVGAATMKRSRLKLTTDSKRLLSWARDLWVHEKLLGTA